MRIVLTYRKYTYHHPEYIRRPYQRDHLPLQLHLVPFLHHPVINNQVSNQVLFYARLILLNLVYLSIRVHKSIL